MVFLIFTFLHCGVNYESPYDDQVSNVTDEEIEAYLKTICLTLGGHIGYEAVGTCGQCGGMTPCCNMAICDACAAAQGVCPFCLKKVDWTKNTDPEKEIPILIAILARSDNLKARQVAIHALTQIRQPGTIEPMMRYANEKMLSLELVKAVGAFKEARFIGYLKRVLQQYAGDDYFGDDRGDIETQYYLSNAVQEAAASLAKIGTKKALDILLRSAKRGKLWERCFAIRALGNCEDKRVKQVLTACLKEFFAKDEDWKWIPGRDLIGATLQSLSHVGDKQAALLVMHYIRNPGCDFLYDELKNCLSKIGKPAVPEITNAIREDLSDKVYDWGRLSLLEALGDIGDTRAIPFFIEMLDRSYDDDYMRGDIKGVCLQGLGKLKASESLDRIARELTNGEDESIRQAAAHALGEIGGAEAFAILEEKLEKSDTEWVVRECLASLNAIAFKEMKTGEAKLKASKITAKKSSYEAAFQLMYQSLKNGELWPVDFFFEILSDVPMRRNFYNVVELLKTNNEKTYGKTLAFLNNVTKLNIKSSFNDSNNDKLEVTQTFWRWFQKHYQELP